MMKDNQQSTGSISTKSMLSKKSKAERVQDMIKKLHPSTPNRRRFSDVEQNDRKMKSRIDNLKRHQKILPMNRKVSPEYTRSTSTVTLKKLNLTMNGVVNSCSHSPLKKIRIPKNTQYNPYLYKNALSIVLRNPNQATSGEKRNELIMSIKHEIDQLEVKQEVIKSRVAEIRDEWKKLRRKNNRQDLRDIEKRLKYHLDLLSKMQFCKEKLNESLMHCSQLN